MTTYTFTGLQVTTGQTGIQSVGVATFELVVSDDYAFGYQPIGTNSFSTDVEITIPSGNLFHANVNGLVIDFNWFAEINRVDRPGGQATDTNLLTFSPGGTTGYILEVSGPALPTITTPAEFEAFVRANTFNSLWTANLAPGTAIDPATFTSLASATENDSIDLAFQAWTGGEIRSGLGQDTVDGSSGNDVIDLGAGNDIGRGGLGSDRILGNSGRDLLLGGSGRDVLLGGAGNDKLDGGANLDRLTGGANFDQFIFKAGYGRDTITDFADGVDKINLSSFGLTQAQVLARGQEVGGNVEITFNATDVLVILNTTEAQLRGDFILA